MARVIGAAGIGDADDGTLQRGIGIARTFDEGLAQKQGKTTVAIIGQAFGHPFAARSGIQ